MEIDSQSERSKNVLGVFSDLFIIFTVHNQHLLTVSTYRETIDDYLGIINISIMLRLGQEKAMICYFGTRYDRLRFI